MTATHLVPSELVQALAAGENLVLLIRPSRFDRLLRKDDLLDEGVTAIFGLAEGKVELLGLSFHSQRFTPAQATAWLAEHKMVPAAPAGDQIPDSPSNFQVPAISTDGRRILVVDDNRDGADSLAMGLKAMGHQVRTAYDGQEGIEAAASFLPEVVLLDLSMPRLNGYEAARCIREQPWGKDLVLIALTGWGREADRRHCAEAGFNHHLLKPVELETLSQLLMKSGGLERT